MIWSQRNGHAPSSRDGSYPGPGLVPTIAPRDGGILAPGRIGDFDPRPIRGPADGAPSGESSRPRRGPSPFQRPWDGSDGPPSPARRDPAVVPAQGVNQNQYSYLNTRDVATGSQADLGFGARLFDAYFGPIDPPEPEDPANPSRRGYEAPFKAPPMPFGDFIGPTIGVNDTSVFPLMDALYKGPNGQAWKDSRIKIYGWVDPSYNAGTSRKSNIPLSYNIVPNKLELSQAILIFERSPTPSRRTTSTGGSGSPTSTASTTATPRPRGISATSSSSTTTSMATTRSRSTWTCTSPRIGRDDPAGRPLHLADRHRGPALAREFPVHPLEHVFGRPLHVHGHPGDHQVQRPVLVHDGIHAGNDMAPWTTSSQPNGEVLLKWVAKNNKDSLFGGVDSIGHGYYKNGHDDLQVFGFTWSHKFNDNSRP